MKNIFLAVVAVMLVFTACQPSRSHKAPDLQKSKKEVANVLEKYVIANENQDFPMIEQIWAPDSDIILFGTNSEEKLMGWHNIKKAIQNQFKAISDTYISPQQQYIKVGPDGKTAWFAEILNYNFVYNGKARSFEGLRFTGVLEKRDGVWKIVQAHLSIPGHVNLRSNP